MWFLIVSFLCLFERSRKCFKIGWPLDLNADFFLSSDERTPQNEVCHFIPKHSSLVKFGYGMRLLLCGFGLKN